MFYCHQHQCSVCRSNFSSERLLSIHLSEYHDSYFRLQAQKRPSYVCLVDGCTFLAWSSNDRREHLIHEHKYPPSYQFDTNRHSQKQRKNNNAHVPRLEKQRQKDSGVEEETVQEMEVEIDEELTAMTKTLERTSLRVPDHISFGGRGRGHRAGRGGRQRAGDKSTAYNRVTSPTDT